ncbi:hypothetical protein M9Y10_020150 [Tritrichomonas musculus]|uniref:DUF3447 domain-containing protein n=1 Tax=Tritrichomonas musculus TaxID=1915356 RepID=A0ABR2HFD1_9EUKA
MNFQFNLPPIEENDPENDTITLLINNYEVKYSRSNLEKISLFACDYFTEHPKSNEIKIDINEKENQNNMEDTIISLFQSNEILINSDNDQFLNELARKLQIQTLEDISENWEIYVLQEAEEMILNVDDQILMKFKEEEELNEKRSLFEKIRIIGLETFCRIVINACIARWKSIQIYLELIQLISIEDVFCRILCHQMEMFDGIFSIREEKSQTICFLARYFYDKGKIKGKKILSIFQSLPVFFADLSDHPFFLFEENRINFQKLVREGINPNPISIILREDDIDSFQKVSCAPLFDINQLIKPSEFEKCDFVNSKPCSLLEFCAFFGSIKCFKFIYLNEESKKSQDLMKYAIAGGNVEIVHICEQIGPINYKETREIAVKYHHWEIFEWLYEHKVSKTIQEEDIFSFFFQSIQFSNFTTLSYVLFNGADYDNALPFTVEHDNILLAKWLIKHKENLFKEESVKSAINNLLHYACRNENVDMLKILLKQKEYNNVNSKYDGKTPIFIAIEKENFDLYKVLIDQKRIKINIRDFSGKQVIHLACEYRNSEILENLLQNKISIININSLDKTNNTPLHLACENGNLKSIQVLFKYYKNDIFLNTKNKQGKTPMMMACLSERVNKRLPIIKLIYEHINDDDKETFINEEGPMKKTLLHFACENKESDVVQYLLSLQTVDVNAIDDDNRTALATSVFFGYNEIIKILLRHPKVDVSITDKNKKNAYEIAVERSLDDEIIHLIQEKMLK